MKKLFSDVHFSSSAIAAVTVVTLTALTAFAGPPGQPTGGNVDANFNTVSAGSVSGGTGAAAANGRGGDFKGSLYGVYGTATDATNGVGVYGTGKIGMQALGTGGAGSTGLSATNNGVGAYGVYATTGSGGTGIYGQSDTGNGVSGVGSASGGSGVRGQGNTTNTYGVVGVATSGNSQAVHGEVSASAANSVAGYFTNLQSTYLTKLGTATNAIEATGNIDLNGKIVNSTGGQVKIADDDGLVLQNGAGTNVLDINRNGGISLDLTDLNSAPYGILYLNTPLGVTIRPGTNANNTAPYGSGDLFVTARASSGSSGVQDYGGNILTQGGKLGGGDLYLQRADIDGNGTNDGPAGGNLHIEGVISNDSLAGFNGGKVTINDAQGLQVLGAGGITADNTITSTNGTKVATLWPDGGIYGQGNLALEGYAYNSAAGQPFKVNDDFAVTGHATATTGFGRVYTATGSTLFPPGSPLAGNTYANAGSVTCNLPTDRILSCYMSQSGIFGTPGTGAVLADTYIIGSSTCSVYVRNTGPNPVSNVTPKAVCWSPTGTPW